MICKTCTAIWPNVHNIKCSQCGGVRVVQSPEIVLCMTVVISGISFEAIRDGVGTSPALAKHSLIVLLPKDGEYTVVQAGRERFRYKNVEYICTTTDWRSRYA